MNRVLIIYSCPVCTIHTETIKDENLEILFRFLIRNRKANAFGTEGLTDKKTDFWACNGEKNVFL